MRKIILDCDPGHDDAVAIMLCAATKEFKLLAITIESGNQTIEKTGRNALNLVQYTNLDVPVILGEKHPLKREPMICEEIHGETGLDGFTFPKLERNFLDVDMVSYIANLIEKEENVTFVTTGPMTNLAKVLLHKPTIINHIDEIVTMGGSIGAGNVTPAAEFNILCDPEAAEICFNTGKVKMFGLDVTRKLLVLPHIVQRIGQINNKLSILFVDLMKFFNKTQKEVFGLDGGPLHDPATIVYLLDDSVFKLEYMNVEIDVSGGCSHGRTNCDRPHYLKRKPNAYVAVEVDCNKYWDVIDKTFRNFKE